MNIFSFGRLRNSYGLFTMFDCCSKFYSKLCCVGARNTFILSWVMCVSQFVFSCQWPPPRRRWILTEGPAHTWHTTASYSSDRSSAGHGKLVSLAEDTSRFHQNSLVDRWPSSYRWTQHRFPSRSSRRTDRWRHTWNYCADRLSSTPDSHRWGSEEQYRCEPDSLLTRKTTKQTFNSNVLMCREETTHALLTVMVDCGFNSRLSCIEQFWATWSEFWLRYQAVFALMLSGWLVTGHKRAGQKRADNNAQINALQ